ncbi:MAG: Mur ligase family protein, partial [Syntrophomonadaceae bacterium]|nr:Mur ligase family protein [Syntrophomonadaceae bacterium]
MPALRRMIEGIEVLHCSGDLDIDISGVQYDSRQVRPGDLFICIPGFTTDGHRFAPAAAAAGARAFLVQEAVDVAPELTVVTVADTRRALPRVASAFFSAPSRQLTVIGVTGTNGKTTTTHLIAAVLEAAGKQVGLMGTLYARWRGVEQGMAHTTPESLDIQRFMRQVLDDGGSHVVMEVSSHALDLGRVDCIDF